MVGNDRCGAVPFGEGKAFVWGQITKRWAKIFLPRTTLSALLEHVCLLSAASSLEQGRMPRCNVGKVTLCSVHKSP